MPKRVPLPRTFCARVLLEEEAPVVVSLFEKLRLRLFQLHVKQGEGVALLVTLRAFVRLKAHVLVETQR